MSSATRSRRRDGRQQQPAQPGGRRAARPDTRTPARSAAAPRLRPQSGNIVGSVRVQQLVLVEIAAALLLVGLVTHPVVLAVAGVVAALLLVVALGRRRRIPLPDWISTVRAMKRRRSDVVPVPQSIESAFAPVVECDPSLRTYEYMDRDQRAIGFVGDGTFLTAVVRVEAQDEPLRPLPGSRPVPLHLLHSVLDIEDIHLESVQFVQYTQPAPAPHLPEQAVAARSYAPLQAQAQTPAVRLTWIALKLDPELCPEAVEARGGGIGGAQRTLLRAADHLVSRLDGYGLRAHVLEEREVVSALGIAVCANPRANAAPGRDGRSSRRTQETSRAWRCDDRWHSSYWVSRWPQLGPGAAPMAGIAQLLSGTRAMASTFSLTTARGSGSSRGLTGYVRLSSRSENELTAAQAELERRAGSVKLGLVRLDREQLPGVLATLPLGGTR
ncbi:type VII secretion protein EccE [Streptomyces sp. NPDC048639]|uniref:type VII secretion protein EccE n=1 Tax=Streptomyces sp. NPDC048639 TaxID=3365581 RepID=UPI0037156A87